MILKNIEIYDGSLLSQRFAYDFHRENTFRTGNIIAFRAPMRVEEQFMVDKEDLISKDFIYSDDAINFCIEIPDVDLFGGVCFQRLFNTHIATILANNYLKCEIEMNGDDIMVHKEHTQGGIVQTKGKASVSIAKRCNNAVLIHTGINVVAGKRAPAFAFSTNLSDDQCNKYMIECCNLFYKLVNDAFLATFKVI